MILLLPLLLIALLCSAMTVPFNTSSFLKGYSLVLPLRLPQTQNQPAFEFDLSRLRIFQNQTSLNENLKDLMELMHILNNASIPFEEEFIILQKAYLIDLDSSRCPVNITYYIDEFYEGVARANFTKIGIYSAGIISKLESVGD